MPGKKCACGSRAVYGAVFGRPTHCRACNVGGFPDAVNRKCACGKTSTHADVPGAKAEKCERCAPGWTDVRSGQCTFPGCNTQATCGTAGGKRTRCAAHRGDLVNVVSRHCDECSSVASYGDPVLRKKVKCGKHADRKTMVNLVSRPCDKCPTQPTFGFRDDERPTRCGKHRDEGMIDIVHPKCEQCGVTASYGRPGERPTSCSEHRAPGMLRNPRKRCECKAPATHGITKQERCADCALDDDVDFVRQKCSKCESVEILNSDGVCGYCGVGSMRLARQREVKQLLGMLLAPEDMYDSYDRSPLDLRDCGGRERPDFMWSDRRRLVILEVDEDQHANYASGCDESRMINIAQALHYEQTVFIRYNPDGYKNANGKRVNPQANARIRAVADCLRRVLHDSDIGTTDTVVAMYYWFDGFDGKTPKFETVLARHD